MATIVATRVDGESFNATVTWTSVTTADIAGAVDVSDLVERTVHIVGSGTAQLQGSNNNSNWVDIGAALAANTLTQLDVNSRYIRFNPIASATVTIILHGKRV